MEDGSHSAASLWPAVKPLPGEGDSTSGNPEAQAVAAGSSEKVAAAETSGGESMTSQFDFWAKLVWEHRHSQAFQDDKMRMYGLYKYVTAGACTLAKPSQLLPGQDTAMAKWDSWVKASTFERDEAQEIYIESAKEIVAAATAAAESKASSSSGTSVTKQQDTGGDEAAAVAAAAAATAPAGSSATDIGTDVGLGSTGTAGVTAREGTLAVSGGAPKRPHHHQKHSGVITGCEMSGWLWKWRDRVAYMWGGSKWDLYFFTLQGATLSMYLTDTEPRPISQLSLRRCIVKDEGLKTKPKKGKKADPTYHIFGVYLEGDGGSNRGADAGVLLRLSTDQLKEADHWVTALEQACSDTSFSLDESESEDLSEASASAHGRAAGASDRTGDRTVRPEHRGRKGSKRVPDSNPDTISVPALPRKGSFYGQQPSIQRAESLAPTPPPADSGAAPSVSVKKRVIKKFDPASYPASRAMHKDVQPSLLSGDSSQQNYRGLMNLCAIILVVNNLRFIWQNLKIYGIIFEVPKVSTDSFRDWPCLSGTLSLNLHILAALAIEYMSKPKWTANRRIPESLLLSLHGLNCTVELCIPLYVVWHYTGAPMFGFAYLFTAVLLWMKLISYAHCNRDLRLAWYHAADAAKRKDDKTNDKADTNNSHTHSAAPPQPPALASTAVSGQTTSYPSNISLSNVYYFWFAPTLSYQLNYPKTPCIRWYYVANLAVRCAIALLLMTLIVEQYILPALQTSFHPITRGDLLSTAETLLALCIPSTYVWLLIFYGFFHVLLNLLAELLRFGDRLFYRDWWNATTIEAYWRLWNLPVHYWMVRHMYFPCLRAGISKTMASVLCFVLSAVFHELLISVPFRMVKFYAFFGMLANVLLVPITKAVDDYCGKGSQAGNWIFWVVFCFVGQPMSVLLYYRDYCSDNHCTMPFAQPHT